MTLFGGGYYLHCDGGTDEHTRTDTHDTYSHIPCVSEFPAKGEDRLACLHELYALAQTAGWYCVKDADFCPACASAEKHKRTVRAFRGHRTRT